MHVCMYWYSQCCTPLLRTVFVHVCMYVYMYIYMYVCTDTTMLHLALDSSVLCMSVCMHVCMCIYMYVCTDTYNAAPRS
jgi:hypothetical protein